VTVAGRGEPKTAGSTTAATPARRRRRRSRRAGTPPPVLGSPTVDGAPTPVVGVLVFPAASGAVSGLDPDRSDPVRVLPAFAHASEAEMARILDFYRIAWEYEPHTYPIFWNNDGAVTESFSPDFWLPELDLYLEMTTLRQKLVRKKNRKLRRIRDLYPDLRIKLFYARDFRALMLKFGRLAMVDALSGSSGQVVRDRAAVVEPNATAGLGR